MGWKPGKAVAGRGNRIGKGTEYEGQGRLQGTAISPGVLGRERTAGWPEQLRPFRVKLHLLHPALHPGGWPG